MIYWDVVHFEFKFRSRYNTIFHPENIYEVMSEFEGMRHRGILAII